MPESAYVLINVLPGQTANVKNLLAQIEEIKTIDACW
ncbi:MAG: Lrp/AsnC family transcriptional regulator, partial [Nitrospira sp. SB0661_bin_20]|nr:Lrp/AsnC family transcriptional regulator [Nitrospira sp. SB0661_bin_20]